MKNSIDRNISQEIVANKSHQLDNSSSLSIQSNSKLMPSLIDAILAVGLQDGMTISFHHHFRNGDLVLNLVIDAIAALGIKNLRLASSSLTTAHIPLLKHIKSGVITAIETSGCRGELAEAISNGILPEPIHIRSHGGRAKAIVSGELPIDVAFLAVPATDHLGNACGFLGNNPCGSLGYAKVDATYANRVVLLTDCLLPYPNLPYSISQAEVDYIVEIPQVGNQQGIMSGATRFTKNPRDLLIAKTTADVIAASEYFYDGFAFQTGSGGASLAATRFLQEKMILHGVKARFALGGITGPIVKLHEQGYIEKLLDVQSFDLEAVRSLRVNQNHFEIDASYYANPDYLGSAVNQLDIVVLSALEIDTDFNVNVITGSDGVIRGASGGHSDTAAGAKLTIIVAPLLRGRLSTILDRVNNVVTPGNSVDVFVTDQGIAVNPRRQELYHQLKQAKLPLFTIHELKNKAEKIAGKPLPIEFAEQVVGLIHYRDSSIIDVIRKVKN